MLIALLLTLAAPPTLPRVFACETDGKSGNYGLRLGGAKLRDGTAMRLLSSEGVVPGHFVAKAAKGYGQGPAPTPAEDLYERNSPSATLVLDSSGAPRPQGEFSTGKCIAVVASEVKKIEIGTRKDLLDSSLTDSAAKRILALGAKSKMSRLGAFQLVTLPGMPGDFAFGALATCTDECEADNSWTTVGVLLGPEPGRAVLAKRADWSGIEFVVRVDGAWGLIDRYDHDSSWHWDLDVFDGKAIAPKGHTFATGSD